MPENGYLAVKNGLGSIHKCGCEIIHINIHGMTLRFTQESFCLLASMVDEAWSELIDKGLDRLINNELEKEEY